MTFSRPHTLTPVTEEKLNADGNYICTSDPAGRKALGTIPIDIFVGCNALLSELLIIMAAGVFGLWVRIENNVVCGKPGLSVEMFPVRSELMIDNRIPSNAWVEKGYSKSVKIIWTVEPVGSVFWSGNPPETVQLPSAERVHDNPALIFATAKQVEFARRLFLAIILE